MSSFNDTLVAEFNGAVKKLSLLKMGNGQYKDPILCVNNVGQRTFLCDFLHQLQEYENPEHFFQPSRMTVQGFAGTGKSFALDFQNMAIQMITCDIHSTLTSAAN